MADHAAPEPPPGGALADLSDDEAAAVDQAMADHMYGHSISNSYAGMTCDPQCRTRALAAAIRKGVLVPRRASIDANA